MASYCQKCERPSTIILGVCSECGYRARPTQTDLDRAASDQDWVQLWAGAVIVAAIVGVLVVIFT